MFKKNIYAFFIVITLIFLSVINAYTYYSCVDFDWFINNMINMGKMNQGAENILTRDMVMIYTMAITFVATVMVILFWFFYICRIFAWCCPGRSVKRVYAYIAYSFLGSMVSAGTVFYFLIAKGGSHTTLNDLKIFSINNLWFNYDVRSKWYNLTTNIDVISLLGFLFLMFVFERYSLKKKLLSCFLVILPDLVYYGLWTLYVYF